ncbi:hypothetical protein P152DRAFT_395890 [Eremomyces bilateralis CBS 781.70]|uniref:RRM domain-containing protein n=1 Tax=Eremomyces bilateralis CBS 781.70 TaxID=1392243 RepID=A0A6G1G4M6_9PEZI|nr:uncharacterized protein P152DRAFT_395890 [Eremomyces bilateralis CBS 781.70]KAF1812952.1 hypothetical protein P152DRAFT_395890 [Eremomyces bilateralis CBS 781.70]
MSGVTHEQLAILTSGGRQATYYTPNDVPSGDVTFQKPLPNPLPIRRPSGDISNISNGSCPTTYYHNNPTTLSGPHGIAPRSTSYGAPDSDSQPDRDSSAAPDSVPKYPNPQAEKRTLYFGNLSDKSTHRDLANIIRGGRLTDIHLRPEQRCATVTFVEGAAEFLAFAKRNDFYLHQKRIDIRWNDRQFHTTPHMAHKISRGATRNLVIRGGYPRLTESAIRDDMEHVHNLVILSVTVRDSDIYISTNSINYAMFARTCMTSRQPYRGLRIEWYADECAEPLPTPRRWQVPSQMPGPRVMKQPQVNTVQLANRFGLLNCEGTEDGSDLDGEIDDEESSSFERIGGVGVIWAPEGIAA